ncbi:MAG: hypothetical protein AAGF50_12000, partial [Pseudomonadota bacterium]
RIDDARVAIAKVLPEIATVRRIGLMVYGPVSLAGGKKACDRIGLRFGPRPDAAEPVAEALGTLEPDGLTPLTASVRAAAETLDFRRVPAIIVLVTDGIETCGGQPCALGRDLAEHGVQLTVHVVGFRMVGKTLAIKGASISGDANADLQCLARETGGRYIETETIQDLTFALRETLGCAMIG